QREEERKFYRGFGQEGLRESLARMFAFDNARAMLDIGQVFSQDRIFANPLEPVRLASVFLIKRDYNDHRVVESLSEAKFMTRLLIGETPDKKREIAYNAYRAVDDDLERDFVDALEREALAADPTEALEGGIYERYQQHRDVPATLEQDFELFRVLYRSARCYDLNTILARDASVRDLREAVARTMALLGRVIDEEPSDIRLTVDDYRTYLKGAELGRVR
ncbi:MAG: hypothetical protein HYX89_03090, partial [Chloroflexi bacterium]|nr:hypothetical protein [Chloroflexota bacterium]